MRWLTIPQIKRKSKTAKGALKVSHEHWNQLYTATAKELRAEYERTDEALVDADYCGLCNYKSDNRLSCMDCVFRDYCPGYLWISAYEAIEKWYYRNSGDWHTWKRACKAVRDKLKSFME